VKQPRSRQSLGSNILICLRLISERRVVLLGLERPRCFQPQPCAYLPALGECIAGGPVGPLGLGGLGYRSRLGACDTIAEVPVSGAAIDIHRQKNVGAGAGAKRFLGL
jgi:hypothetical protein